MVLVPKAATLIFVLPILTADPSPEIVQTPAEEGFQVNDPYPFAAIVVDRVPEIDPFWKPISTLCPLNAGAEITTS